MKKSEHSRTVLGIGRYRPEQWALLLTESVDRDQLASTHAEWLVSAAAALDEIRAEGILAVKIDIDVEDMIAWCAKQGIPLDSDARSRYIAYQTELRSRRREVQ